MVLVCIDSKQAAYETDEYRLQNTYIHQKPIIGYTKQSLLLYDQSSLILAWTVHYVI